MSEIKVTLGAHEVPVYPQRHAYLTNKLGKWFGTIIGSQQELEGVNTLGFLGERTYEVLGVMIPTLPKRMPKWEWDGYGSADAAERGEYVEDDDKSPTVPEIIDAFQVAIEVNRFDVFKAVMKVVDPQLIRSWINAKLAEQLTSTALPNSPSHNGESDQMNFGTTAPISSANAA